MVRQIKKKGKTFYICEACNFVYKTRELAKSCQDYCTKYKSCSLEITKHAVKI